MSNCCQVLITRWFSAIFSRVSTELNFSQYRLLLKLLQKFAVSLFTCIFAIGGAIVGTISGAIKGQTTETGFLRGVGVGAVAGAVTGVQLMELIVNGEPFSKVALICSLVNGKIFMEWVSPAVLKAYQWQISSMETSLREISDIFEVSTSRGLCEDTINKLPIVMICNSSTAASYDDIGCIICLQDIEDGDTAKLLPSCRHFFHPQCIDEWLTMHRTCPVCRTDV